MGRLYDFGPLLQLGGDEGAEFAFSDRVQVVDIEGELVESRPILEQLKRYEDSNSVKAILLNIDSPGGGVAVSQEIYAEIKRLREKKDKTIVAYLSSTGASGAYYISCAANKIVANPGTIVGSIGVIAEWVNYGDLLHWAKLKDITMKAGEFKDTGSPTRDMTPAEKEYLQSLIDNMHGQFIQAVADGRKTKFDDIKAIANGKVWTGEQALSMKLIDQVGDFQAAVDDTARSVGIKGEPVLVHPERDRKTVLDVLFGDVSEWLPTREKLLEHHVGFYYLWK